MRYLAEHYRVGDFPGVISAYDVHFAQGILTAGSYPHPAATKLVSLSTDKLVEKYLERHVPRQFQEIRIEQHAKATAIERIRQLPRPRKDDNSDYHGGLIISGKERFETSLAAFSLLRYWVLGDGMRFQHHSGFELGEMLLSAKDPSFVQRFLALEDEVLFIEDLSSLRLSARSAKTFLNLINSLIDAKHPLVVTVDLRGRELIEHWCAFQPSLEELVGQIVARLRKYSIFETLDPSETTAPSAPTVLSRSCDRAVSPAPVTADASAPPRA